MSKAKSISNEIRYDIPLPHIDLEKPKYVVMIRYQNGKKIRLGGRYKTSPRYDTMYGALYWLNMQPYNLEYFVYRTNKNEVIREGVKRIGEVVK